MTKNENFTYFVDFQFLFGDLNLVNKVGKTLPQWLNLTKKFTYLNTKFHWQCMVLSLSSRVRPYRKREHANQPWQLHYQVVPISTYYIVLQLIYSWNICKIVLLMKYKNCFWEHLKKNYNADPVKSFLLVYIVLILKLSCHTARKGCKEKKITPSRFNHNTS